MTTFVETEIAEETVVTEIPDEIQKKVKNDQTDKIEYRAVIKHLTAKGLTGSVIYKELRQTMGDKCPARSTVFRWMSEFENGRTSVQDEIRPPRIRKVCSDDKVDEIRRMISANRHITMADIANTLSISRSATHRVVQDVLKMNYDAISKAWQFSHREENNMITVSDYEDASEENRQVGIRSQILRHLCQYCGRGFSTTSGLKNHLIIHSDVKAFKCPTCSREFRRRNDVKQHMNVHMPVERIRKHECKYCGKKFAVRNQLIIHVRIHVKT